MKSSHYLRAGVLALVAAATTGCHFPGKPGPNYLPTRPDQITNFEVLYQRNCQACHGVHGQGGIAISLANPAYIAYAGSQHMAAITANGIGGGLMPAFAKSAGGYLTDQQIEILADGIVGRWANTSSLGGATPPPYESQATGNASAGAELYRADCLRCHAPGPSSILDPNYLALVSNGGLRSLIVAGKPHEGMPDWRGYPGGPLNDQQMTDIVSFLVSHRNPVPGQPFPNAEGAPNPADAAAEHLEYEKQQRLAIQAGPATGGPKNSKMPIPVATPKVNLSPKP